MQILGQLPRTLAVLKQYPAQWARPQYPHAATDSASPALAKGNSRTKVAPLPSPSL
jgi:hypothetical protein